MYHVEIDRYHVIIYRPRKSTMNKCLYAFSHTDHKYIYDLCFFADEQRLLLDSKGSHKKLKSVFEAALIVNNS